MAGFDTYKDAFPHAKLTRSQEGVLEVVLHTNGGTLVLLVFPQLIEPNRLSLSLSR